MSANSPICSATEAARELGKPKMARTFIRRAQEALARGDTRVTRIGHMYCAPMAFWREIQARPAGRPRRSPPRPASRPELEPEPVGLRNLSVW